jgi:hypothetical protein
VAKGIRKKAKGQKERRKTGTREKMNKVIDKQVGSKENKTLH